MGFSVSHCLIKAVIPLHVYMIMSYVSGSRSSFPVILRSWSIIVSYSEEHRTSLKALLDFRKAVISPEGKKIPLNGIRKCAVPTGQSIKTDSHAGFPHDGNPVFLCHTAMYLVGGMMKNQKIRKKIGGRMTEGMVMPYKAVIEKAGKKKR